LRSHFGGAKRGGLGDEEADVLPLLSAEESAVMRYWLVPSLYGLGIVVLLLSLVVGTFVKSEAAYLGITLVGFGLCGIAAYLISE
jgi:hypothetical protein